MTPAQVLSLDVAALSRELRQLQCDCTGCARCAHCSDCTDCTDCAGCTDCWGCVNLNGNPDQPLRHRVLNVQLTDDEWQAWASAHPELIL